MGNPPVSRCRRALRSDHCPTRHSLRIRRGDAGFGLIEMVISLALLAIIIVPIVRIIAETQTGSDALHLRAEAADLATQALETAQYETSNGVNPTSGVTTSTQKSGNNTFSVALDYELVAGTGTESSICAAPPGQLSSQIWTVKAKVSWGPGPQRGAVVETTLISPAEVDLADTNAAEIAVPVFNADDSTYETTTPITITVNGSAPSGTVPSNETTTNPRTPARPVARYSPTSTPVAGKHTPSPSRPPWAGSTPTRSSTTRRQVRSSEAVTVQPNQVTPVTNPNLILAPAATMTVNSRRWSFTPVTVPSVITVSAIKSVTHSGGFPGVSPGMIISIGIAVRRDRHEYFWQHARDVTSRDGERNGDAQVQRVDASGAGALPPDHGGQLEHCSATCPRTISACWATDQYRDRLLQLDLAAERVLFATATATTYSAWTGDQVDSDPGVWQCNELPGHVGDPRDDHFAGLPADRSP